MRTTALVLVAACWIASACTRTGGAIAGSCTVDSDCGPGGLCGFAGVDACGALGQCFPPRGICVGYSSGCACDGSDVNLVCTGLPAGYFSKPLAHAGSCGDAGGGACGTDADCGATGICGFAERDARSAAGRCFPAPGAVCQAYAAGCACDGTLIDIACTGLPSGYASKPLAHTGLCRDASGASDGAACCPPGWGLYSCTYPDGVAGLACHNPALGCASSLTCGEGCDFVVEGACAGD